MSIAKLDALRAWQLLLVLLALGLSAALGTWGLVWVLWTIRPLLAAAGAVGAVAAVLLALHRHRRRTHEEWIGS